MTNKKRKVGEVVSPGKYLEKRCRQCYFFCFGNAWKDSLVRFRKGIEEKMFGTGYANL